MKAASTVNSQFFQLLRCYSRKNDPLYLANALQLLSPSKSAEKFKPSLFTHFQKGPVAERYQEIKNELLPKYTIPNTDYRKQLGSLIADLQATVGIKPSHLNTHATQYNVKSLTNEDELVDVARLSYYKNTLSPPLLTQILLNKNLQDLSRLPFDIHNLDRESFRKCGWKSKNYLQVQILLLKKYHDLKDPPMIKRVLDEFFLSKFLPLIKKRELLPMYERIVWKFCFEHILYYNEVQMIEKLNCLQSSILIWEASLKKNYLVAQKILHFHTLPPLLELFFGIVVCDPVQTAINQDLNSRMSTTLSQMKRISIKCKLYNYDNSSTAINRALAYSIIHNLSELLSRQAAEAPDPHLLQEFIEKLATERNVMSERSEVTDISYNDKLFTDERFAGRNA